MLLSSLLVTGLLAITSVCSAFPNPGAGQLDARRANQHGRGSRPDILPQAASRQPPWLKRLIAQAIAHFEAIAKARAQAQALAASTAGTKAGTSTALPTGASSGTPTIAPVTTAAVASAVPASALASDVSKSILPSTLPAAASALASDLASALPSGVQQPAPSGAPPAVLLADTSAPGNITITSVPVGIQISSCIVPGTIALTFDDGPYLYTPKILDMFQKENVKATFFVNGNNFANIMDPENQAIVKRIVNEGHLLGHHTWNHPDLATLSKADITTQFTQLEDALIKIVGKYPTYFRAPFFSTNALVLKTAGELGYHVMNADIDSKDYDNLNNMAVGVANFKKGLDANGSIVLAHDVHQATAETLVPAMLAEIKARGLKGVTVAECLGDPVANWYRTR